MRASARGDGYYVIGFEFDRGAFTSRAAFSIFRFELTTFDVPPTPLAYHAYTLARLPSPMVFLDLRTAARDPLVAHWLARPHLSHQLDEMYWLRRLRERWITIDRPWPRLYDAIMFVRVGTAAWH